MKNMIYCWKFGIYSNNCKHHSSIVLPPEGTDSVQECLSSYLPESSVYINFKT